MAWPSSSSVTVTLCSPADLGQHQAKAHAPLGDLAVFGLAAGLLATCPRPPARSPPSARSFSTCARCSSNSASTMRGGRGMSWRGVERVQQGALELEARGRLYSRLEVLAQGVAQRRPGRLNAEALGEVVVGLGRLLGRADLLDLDVELGRLALQAIDLIVVGEGDRDVAGLARLRRRPAALRIRG